MVVIFADADQYPPYRHDRRALAPGPWLEWMRNHQRKARGGTADIIPTWAGGLPSDAPPRPGTAKYDEYMKERERKRLMPAAERGEENKAAPTSQDAAH